MMLLAAIHWGACDSMTQSMLVFIPNLKHRVTYLTSLKLSWYNPLKYYIAMI